ncbi:MAG: biotin transporter BioY [Armatimonadota bacterium]
MNTKYAQSQPVAVSLTGALMTVAQAVGVALALVVAAKLRIYLPWSPVPITLQTFVMLTAGAALPISAAAGGAAVYVALSSTGLPVLAGPGIFGPTGGYVLGFLAAMAFLASRGPSGPWELVGRLLTAEIILYACGVSWLAAHTGLGAVWVIRAGFVPFIVGDTIKLLAAWAAIGAWQGLRRDR